MFTFPESGVAPGVYIRELDRPGPIAGVGTSNAAIIGPAQRGPMGVPTSITNPTQFETVFGGPVGPPPVYAPLAARAFFDNGGSRLFFVRVGTADQASLPLNDTGGTETLRVRAIEDGLAQNGITVEVAEVHLADTEVARFSSQLANPAAAGDTTVTVDDAAGFRPGDVVLLDDGGGTTEQVPVESVDTGAGEFTFGGALANAYPAAAAVRIADLAAGRQRMRVASAAGLEKGAYVEIDDGNNSETAVVEAVEPSLGLVELAKPLGNTYPLNGSAVAVRSLEFELTVKHPDHPAQASGALSMDPRHPDHYANKFSSDFVTLEAPDTPNSTAPPANRPAEVSPAQNLAGGQDDGDPSTFADNLFTDALEALEKVDEVNMVMIPDRTSDTLQTHIVDHCIKMQDRFAILDPPAGLDANAIEQHRDKLAADKGFAALYYPRVVISDPNGGRDLTVPPSGHVAGLYARVDSQRGVHKAPANEGVRGVIGLERLLNDADQAPLNDKGINVVRSFVGRGIRVWGARTLAPRSQTQWRYVNVRRLLLFIEESIQEGTQWAVFEPNNQQLWKSVKRQVDGFLDRVWRSGALVGTEAAQAYRVRIDEELNPPETRALGQLRIEVRVAPTTPAEFVVFFITQQPGEPIVDE